MHGEASDLVCGVAASVSVMGSCMSEYAPRLGLVRSVVMWYDTDRQINICRRPACAALLVVILRTDF
jgi:hypothetical protein